MRIREKENWTQKRVAEELGIDRTSLSRMARGKRSEDSLEAKLFSLACRIGLVSEVMLVLIGAPDGEISTLMWASVLFPDLAPGELKALREVEAAFGGTKPLPAETIRFVVETLRETLKPPLAGEGGMGREAHPSPK